MFHGMNKLNTTHVSNVSNNYIYLGYSCDLSACLSDNIRLMLVRSGMERGYHELTKSYGNGVEVSLEAVVVLQQGKTSFWNNNSLGSFAETARTRAGQTRRLVTGTESHACFCRPGRTPPC